MKIHGIGFISAMIYTTIALITAGLFLVVTLAGKYDWVARIGGAIWVFLLSMIVLMPLVTSLVKRYRRELKTNNK